MPKSQRHHHRNRRFVPLSEVESDVGTEGEKYISQITKDRYYQNLLTVAADYMIERNN